MEVPEKITCVDCGQPAHRLTHPPEDGWEIGDIVAYRCSGCNDRWDLVVEFDETAEIEPSAEAVQLAEARALLEARKEEENRSRAADEGGA